MNCISFLMEVILYTSTLMESIFQLIVQAGDWLFIPAGVEHWIKETEDHYLVIVSYHCEPFEIFHAKVKYTATKSEAFI